jgi:hypothetical protein
MKLKEVNPEGFEQLIQFANENELSILDEAGQQITLTT